MKNIMKFLFFFILITACQENLDINDNPNTPVNVDKSFVLTAAQASLANGIGGQLTNLGGFLAQYHTQPPSASQYVNIDTYNMNIDFSDRLWNELWAGCLNDLKFVLEESDEQNDTGTYLIATLLRVYTFQLLTDLYGDIPYSEALLGSENITPNPDSGSDIYAGIIAELDNAVDKYNNDPVASNVGAQDAIYNADMDEWIRFANTLKLKLYIRMAYTSQANSAVVNSLLADDNFITTDAKFALYEDAIDKANPFYDVQIDRLGDVNNIASNSLLQFLQAYADPRIDAIYRKNSGGIHLAIDQGDRGNYTSDVASDFSRPNVIATSPVYLMTVAESNFLQAEALIRYSSGAGAKAKYDAGVLNSFLLYGEDAATADSFTTTGGSYEYTSSGNIENDIRQVIIQKWVSLAYVNNIEGFFETNRTLYPETVALGDEDYTVGNFVASESSVLTGTQTPNTIFYPDTETTKNPNIVQKTSITEKVWWDQK
ncbi:SusD/RagB family nutrient-binding outer membrane lipoprotein [Flavivirga sp. 57AJ16]|uniref:SusD/RagB family nutrient-binding outer membrane lipoprotein n=1 Tax=Flavivirga sp. 57AJ16 TaxID=3025307 RepID=UPI00236531C3|nr:SusD/RagB family nutrient-binding outer membrane lipoprotein [Flavivirga sp. 57AJ16]MDD7886427.1 SusD/RagB family nutrient-binding outer membrane lipoprotein [Flavivirga sp. 57AJ16]